MPRPSKRVSPDTLGGRIRAAREHLRLSLTDVADGHYSASLLSQIERNRVDPSQESLRFLAGRLQLSIEDLEALAQQHREQEIAAQRFKSSEDLRLEVAQLLAKKDFHQALTLLKDLHFPQIPAPQRWRLAALRGQCYFEQRKFLKAQQDFVYAVNEQPQRDDLPPDQHHDLMLLHLHLAGTYRELQQPDAALEHYRITLELINCLTPFGYVAEAYWGMALITHAQANSPQHTLTLSTKYKENLLRSALDHAEKARLLYHSIGEQIRADSVTCQIAQIEQALGETDKVQERLKDVLANWSYIITAPIALNPVEKRRQQEAANVVSCAACSLAGIALEANDCELALRYVDQAVAAGKRSYKLRRADAYLMRGRILEAINPYDTAAEEAFRQATQELADTHRIAARISAHVRFGRHLLKIGKIEEGEQELEQARLLSDLVSAESNTMNAAEDMLLA